MNWTYNDDRTCIVLDSPPKARLKVTGTRLASILGLNPWTTPFQAWCEITKAAKVPFEDTKYTLAGKAIEPKQIEYVQENINPNIQSPEQFFGNSYSSVKFDFYPQMKRFGGMWDAINVNKKNTTMDIYEFKTSSRPQDWVDGPPLYYLIQVLEYAYLQECKRVHLVVTFLEDNDYNHPEKFIVDEVNTMIFTFFTDTQTILVNGNIYNINELMEMANSWYDKYIETGISPKFDEKKDKEFLDILRLANPGNDINEVDELTNKAEELLIEIKKLKVDNNIDTKEKELEKLEASIKKKLLEVRKETDTMITSGIYTLSIPPIVTVDIEKLEKKKTLYKKFCNMFDEKAFKASEYFNDYSITKDATPRLTKKLAKGE